MLWASPSLTRHDVQSKRPSSISFMEVRATVDCCPSARVLEKWDLLTMFGLRKLGFWHGLSFRQPSLKDSASALRRFRLDCCWATNPGVPPACAGNAWGWSWLRWPASDENICIKFTWKIGYACRRFCRNIEAQVHWLIPNLSDSLKQIYHIANYENLQLCSHCCTAAWVKLWMSEANRCGLLSLVPRRSHWRRSCWRWDCQNQNSRTCTRWEVYRCPKPGMETFPAEWQLFR